MKCFVCEKAGFNHHVFVSWATPGLDNIGALCCCTGFDIWLLKGCTMHCVNLGLLHTSNGGALRSAPNCELNIFVFEMFFVAMFDAFLGGAEAPFFGTGIHLWSFNILGRGIFGIFVR